MSLKQQELTYPTFATLSKYIPIWLCGTFRLMSAESVNFCLMFGVGLPNMAFLHVPKHRVV